MKIVNLSDKIIDNLLEESKSTMLNFYSYILEYGAEDRDSLELEKKLEYTFDVSILVSRLIFSLTYFMAHKTYLNKEINLERLLEFTKTIEETPSEYACETQVLTKYKILTDNLYNSAIRHRDIFYAVQQKDQ